MNSEENELLTRTGEGTRMGEYLRQHWVPVLPSGDLEIDAPPVRIRVFGEDAVAFRDSAGKVGALSPRCAHRGASLYFGRNEECGLRCVYHGWKFDSVGQCVDTPNAPEALAGRVRQPSWLVRERNGVIWAYLGDPTEAPRLPDMEFNDVDLSNVYIGLRVQHCNWLQALEGSLDSSHGPLLHSRLDRNSTGSYFDLQKKPDFQVVETEFGLAIGARRKQGDQFHWRVNLFALPFYTMVPPAPFDPRLNGQAWIPIDDTETLVFHWSYHPTDPVDDDTRNLFDKGRRDGLETGHLSSQGRLDVAEVPADMPYRRYWPRYTAANDYGIDYERQKLYYSGIPGIWPQDAAAQESMGAIVDRSAETLCSSDIGIVRARRSLLAQVQQGAAPPKPESYRVRPIGLLSDSAELSTVLDQHLSAHGKIEYDIR